MLVNTYYVELELAAGKSVAKVKVTQVKNVDRFVIFFFFSQSRSSR